MMHTHRLQGIQGGPYPQDSCLLCTFIIIFIPFLVVILSLLVKSFQSGKFVFYPRIHYINLVSLPNKCWVYVVLPQLSSKQVSQSSWAENSWAELISQLSDSGGSAQLWSWLSTSFNWLSYKLRSELGYTWHLHNTGWFSIQKNPSCLK